MKYLGLLFMPAMLVIGLFLLVVGIFADGEQTLAVAGAVMLGSVLISLPSAK